MTERKVPKESLTVVVDPEKCNGCEICSACNYGAIVVEAGFPKIDFKTCERCGVCVTICSIGAMTMKKVE